MPIIYSLLLQLLKTHTATFEANMTNYFQDITKNQRLLTVPSYELTLLCNMYIEEKYFTFFCLTVFIRNFTLNENINHLVAQQLELDNSVIKHPLILFFLTFEDVLIYYNWKQKDIRRRFDIQNFSIWGLPL